MLSKIMMLLILNISLSSLITPVIDALAQQNDTSAIEQKIEKLTQDQFWLIVGVLVAAFGTVVTFCIDIYDRRNQSKTQTLELVRSYGQQLTDLMDKERNLNTKKDCETYVTAYLDLMDQIAFLYKKGSIPPTVTKYFENNFGYAKTMLIWFRGKKYVLPNNEKTEITSMHWYGKNEIPIPKAIKDEWKDLVEWCDEKKFDAFDDDDLPEAMQKYDSLPDDDMTGLLELVRNYGQQLTELMYKELDMKTKLDCDLYATAYLDLMDQIAFLYKKGSIPPTVTKYFENNFGYAKTLLNWVIENEVVLPNNEKTEMVPMHWYGKNEIPIPKAIKDEWKDLVELCDKEKIDVSDASLPEAMQEYNSLPKTRK